MLKFSQWLTSLKNVAYKPFLIINNECRAPVFFGSSPTTKQEIDPIKGVNENESKKERRKRRKTVACITSAIIAMSMMRFWEVVTWETHWRHRSRTRLTNSSSKKKNSIVLWISDYLQSQWTPFSHMVPLIVGDVREALDSYYLIIIILY